MFMRPRLIPCLTMINRGLVKTTRFSDPRYLGDPINSVKIFNGKGVDELAIIDIRATQQKREPDFEYLMDLASEAFMPLSYGGGITQLSHIEKLFHIGYEKVIINSALHTNPQFIRESAQLAGSQSIVVSIDVKTELFNKKACYTECGSKKVKQNPIALAKFAESLGAGEILLNSISHDGMMKGYDLPLVKEVTQAVKIPVIACGGAKDIHDLKRVLVEGGAHAAAAGSMFVYYGKQKAVLINAPTEKDFIREGIYRE